MKTPIVLLDACVLYPAPLRDFLMHLALLDVFAARWSELIHDEWIRNLLEVRPDLTKEKLLRTRNLMNSHVRDCLVENFEHLIDKLSLPDEDDRHVLAAAIKAKADFILTFNLRDFPAKSLEEFGIKAIAPDEFLSKVFADYAEEFEQAFLNQLKSLKNPPKTAEELLEILRNQSLEKTVEKLAAVISRNQSSYILKKS